MKYMGSKNRISKYILPLILKDRSSEQFYVEPFVGGANLIDKVSGNRIGGDNNLYLISMWKALQDGWKPPENISKKLYNECRKKYNEKSYKEEELKLIGYVGFSGSYGGRFYDGGYAGVVGTKENKKRNYPAEAYRNIMKQIPSISEVSFIHSSYLDLDIPKNSIIYCDIPYNNSKKYKSSGNFNYEEFWEWCRNKTKEGHSVFVSEYEAPQDFLCIWEKEINNSLSLNGRKANEKLFIFRDCKC